MRVIFLRLLGCLVLVIAAGVSLERSRASDFSLMNSYNRVFNGVGWVAQDVSAWNAVTFNERIQFFESNKESMQARTLSMEPMECCRLMGTSFWPDFHAYLLANPDKAEQFVVDVKENVTAMSMFRLFEGRPGLAFRYFETILIVAAMSNYSLEYIKAKQDGHQFNMLYDSFVVSILRNFGVIFFGSGLILFAFSRGFHHKLLCVYCFIGAPVFVVVGDGFYEFEKHLFPYFMLLPVVGLYLWGAQNYRSKQHQMSV